MIALYVDDLIICGVTEAIDDVKRHLCNKYNMKDLGVINRIYEGVKCCMTMSLVHILLIK